MHSSTLDDAPGRQCCQSMLRLLTLLLVTACYWGLGDSASAESLIVDINAMTNATTTDGDNDDPSAVAVSLTLSAGTYEVVPIGPGQGGAFTAWNAWGGATFGCDANGANCSQGWMHWYRLQSSEFARVRVQDGILYSTPAAALANSLGARFTLTADGVVYFFVFDTGPGDNVGGVSLQVTRVPDVTLSCAGFEPPIDAGPVTIRKSRALPFKAVLLDGDGAHVTSLGSAPPVIQVTYAAEGGNAVDVTDLSVPVGLGTDGNQFVYADGKWQFNLQTKGYTAHGTYTVTMAPGNGYAIHPTCTGAFVVK